MMRKIGSLLCIGIVLLLFMAPAAHAQTNANTPDIIQIKHSILTVQELEQQGILTHADAEKSTTYYLAQAAKIAGHTLTLSEVMATPDQTPQILTPLQQFAGAIDFLRIILVIGILAVVGSVVYLFRYSVEKLLRILKHVPIIVYEIVFYVASIGCGLWGWFLPEPMHSSLGLVACLLFAGALGFSASYRKHLVHIFIFSSILFLAWTPAAILFNSSLIGFFAVGALLSALGFNSIVSAVFSSLQFREEAFLDSATFGAFLILTLFIGLRVLTPSIPALAVFEFGALLLGSLVGYMGLLCLSNRWYNQRKNARYLNAQIVAIIAGLGALFFGSVFQIGELQKIGGTFFVLYCLIKIAEIPTKSRPAFALLIAFTGSLTVWFCWFALTHQILFQQWLFLPS